MSLTHAQSVEPLDVQSPETADMEILPHKAGSEIIVECLEGQVAITASAKTQNLHAGELLYLPAGESPSVKSVEPASLLLSFQDAEPNGSENNETIHARGVFLSVMQVAAWLISLALLLVAAAGNVFAGALVIGVFLVIFGRDEIDTLQLPVDLQKLIQPIVIVGQRNLHGRLAHDAFLLSGGQLVCPSLLLRSNKLFDG